MRFSLPLLLAIAAAGCASPDTETDTVVVTDPDPVVETTPAPDPAAQTTYACESGTTILASYPTDDTAVVEYEGQTLQMTIAESGSGARYVGGELEWWTKGMDEGTLFRHNADGTSGDLVETCAASV